MSISQAKLKELLHYNPVTGVFTWVIGRSRTAAGSVANTKDRKGYLKAVIDKKPYYLHRLAFLFMVGEFPPDLVDHINGDRADNRWCNLRPVTYLENARNQKLNSGNLTGVRGVSWDERSSWKAYAYQNNRQIFLGRFDSLFEAAAARRSFELQHKYHGNHGRNPATMRSKIPVVYVAGPYRASSREKIADNISAARAVAVSTARLGWFPICPHTNTAHFDDELPDQDQFFLDGTLALMERCDAVVLIDGWRYSAGTLGEVHRARELGMPIFGCLEDLPTAEEFSGMTVVNAHDLVSMGNTVSS
ncbi:DUF1937 family protein [Pseudomonas sp. IPO3774]|uniref:DUF1937 family protein n=1 Tax=Pseudomonas sp. IPO3774 TaxID=2738826 RepID=UPI0015A1B559|nr:DUF1937 family protein [Pseudomonas sp. IPO3774]NWD65774.1 DUF1937 family protein [Pseudomonas sp. IPO3774]